MALSIRKGDQVRVLSGKDRGRTGRVLEVQRDARGCATRILVEHINMVHKHRRQTQQRQGGIVEQEAYIDASNVSLMDPKSGSATRIGMKVDEQGNKSRIAKKSNSPV